MGIYRVEKNVMPFDSLPSDSSLVQEYNRQLLQMTDWYQYQVSNTITYNFHYECADDHDVVDDFTSVERSYLMKDSEIEKIWDEIADANSRYFVRKDLTITYPNCLLAYDEDPLFF